MDRNKIDSIISHGQIESLPARGAWIEIHFDTVSKPSDCCRSPQGERGSKFLTPPKKPLLSMSLPARGAWIEINASTRLVSRVSSLPARGAWIEIVGYRKPPACCSVAPRKGSVDRNWNVTCHSTPSCCRSPQGERGSKSGLRLRCLRWSRRSPQGERGSKSCDSTTTCNAGLVAPRKGSVDRNLSSEVFDSRERVAPRKGSVDRNQ